MPPRPGEIVAGKYRIERLIGEGGMGAVYVATNERLQKQVALKVLNERIASLQSAFERFVREPIAASRTKHPGIVEIYDADIDRGVPWIAMELLQGETLSARLRRGPLPLIEALGVMAEALSAVATVHDAGIVHRDLKPENIFLERLPHGAERVKVLDFGIAKITMEERDRLTRTGMTMGTLEFFAPEQAMGKRDIDHRVDVYSAGAILFHALSGNVPYEADSIGQLITKMLQEGPRPVARVAPHLPPEVAALIDRCLAVDPDRRPRTARELLTEVAALRARLLSGPGTARTVPMPAHAPSATPPPPTRFHPTPTPLPTPAPLPTGRDDSRSFTIAVFAVVILIAVIGLGALALRALIDAVQGPDGDMELLEDPEGQARDRPGLGEPP